MKKILLLLLVPVFAIQVIHAQNTLNGNFRRFSFGVSGGVPLITGDIKNKFVGYDVAARLNWNLTSAFSIGGEFGIGSVKGEESANEYFTNNYLKALVGGEIYLFNLFKFNRLSDWLQPYAGLNIGAIKSNIDASQSPFHFNDWTWANQINAGIKFKLSNALDLNLGGNVLYTGSDLIDNYDPNSHKNKSRDAISTVRLGFTVHLGRRSNSSVIWKDNDVTTASNTKYEDSIRIHTQMKLQEFESKIMILEKRNAQLNNKLDLKSSKLAETAKEVTELENELNTVRQDVSTIENNLEKAPVLNTSTTIYFGTASDDIPTREKDKLAKIANFMIANPATKVAVKGYTDKRGAALYNLRLSLQRANKVKNYLTTIGVPSNRIEAKGFGEDHSLPNSEQGNRRVVLTVE